MSPDTWRERVGGRLRCRGLPESYVERLLRELGDHYEDLVQEGQAMKIQDGDSVCAAQECLGAPEMVADFAYHEYRRRDFWGRHPLLALALLPVPLTFFCWQVMLLLFLFPLAMVLQSVELIELPVTQWPATVLWLFLTVILAVGVAPPALTAWWYCRWTRRHCLGEAWSIAGCVLIALLSAMTMVMLSLDQEPGARTLAFALDWQVQRWSAETLCKQVLQMCIPVVIGLWCATHPRPVVERPDRRPGFWARQRILAYLLLPVPGAALLWIVFLLAAEVLFASAAFNHLGVTTSLQDWPWPVLGVLLLWFALSKVVPFVVPALAVCHLARRHPVHWAWPLAACISLMLPAALLGLDLDWHETLFDGVALAFPLSLLAWPAALWAAVQMAGPLAVGAWSAHRMYLERQ